MPRKFILVIHPTPIISIGAVVVSRTDSGKVKVHTSTLGKSDKTDKFRLEELAQAAALIDRMVGVALMEMREVKSDGKSDYVCLWKLKLSRPTESGHTIDRKQFIQEALNSFLQEIANAASSS